MNAFAVTLSWPPSEAEYFSHIRAVTRVGDRYRQMCARDIGAAFREHCKPISIALEFHEPCAVGGTARARVLTNYVAPVIDTLKFIGIFVDMSQIDGLSWSRKKPGNVGYVYAFITEAGHAL